MAFTKVSPAGIGSTPGDGYRIGDSFLHSTGVEITNINATGISGGNSVKITLNGEGEIIEIYISPEILKEDKTIIEDLIKAAHNNAKSQLKSKTSEEISKAAGGFNIPGFKWPL